MTGFALKDYGSNTYCFVRLLGVSITSAYPVSPLSCKRGVLHNGNRESERVSTPPLVPFEFHCWLGSQTKGKHRYAELLLATSRPIVPIEMMFEVSKVRKAGQCCFSLSTAQNNSALSTKGEQDYVIHL